MKIGLSKLHISSAENLYRQFKASAAPAHPAKINQTGNKTADGAADTEVRTVVKPVDILTGKEVETLQALFGNESGKDFYYGRRKMQQPGTGYLLDVKG